jgi:hypothetical protein
MRLIDADVATTDSVSYGRIGDFENSSAPRPRKNLRTIDASRWRPTSKLAHATRKARGSRVKSAFEEGPILAAR